jgi:streptomycin 6-kinase
VAEARGLPPIVLNFDRARLRGWAVAQTVLSAWWCLEDTLDCWNTLIADATLLASLTG